MVSSSSPQATTRRNRQQTRASSTSMLVRSTRTWRWRWRCLLTYHTPFRLLSPRPPSDTVDESPQGDEDVGEKKKLSKKRKNSNDKKKLRMFSPLKLFDKDRYRSSESTRTGRAVARVCLSASPLTDTAPRSSLASPRFGLERTTLRPENIRFFGYRPSDPPTHPPIELACVLASLSLASAWPSVFAGDG